MPFLITHTRRLKFGTVEASSDRQLPTITKALETVLRVCQHRGFGIHTIFADPEFEPLRPTFPALDTCGADDHIPDIERHIRTVKDRTRSTCRMLPFDCIPRLMLVHLMKNVVFWLDSFPATDGISSTDSPRHIMTGQRLDCDKHVRLEFGECAQTHEEHDNDMTDRTVGAMCMGPSGDKRGSHWLMSLLTGSRLTRT